MKKRLASHGEEQLKPELARQLRTRLRELVIAKLLTDQVERILLLRLGLEDGQCHTLKEVADILAKSSEWIRIRQHLALKHCTNDLQFKLLLSQYDQIVKLPKGLTYYLYRYKSDKGDFPY